MRVEESIYLDYQSTTPVDQRVFLAMEPFFKEAFGNPHSTAHLLGWRSSSAVDDARAGVARLINATPEEIIFTSGATESNNQAIFGAIAGNETNRKTVLVSAIEHKCVKEAAYFFSRKFGHQVKEIPVLTSGKIDLEAYKSLLTEDVLIVSIMAVNNEIGTIQDLGELIPLAHQKGALFHSDCAQAPLAKQIDTLDLGVDLLSLSAHKLYGPKGVGALFIDSYLHEKFPALIHGGGQQGGFRSGTIPTALCVGFSVAADIIIAEGDTERLKLQRLKNLFLEKLADENLCFNMNGDPYQRHPGNINIEFPGTNGESLLQSMQPYICASTGSACNTGFTESSYVLKAIGRSEDQASAAIRFSLGRYTDESQISETVNRLAKILHKNRSFRTPLLSA